MQSLIHVLWQASLSMMLFYGFYHLAFAKQTRFVANRIYLLGALLVSVFIALFPIQYNVAVPFMQTTVENFGGLASSQGNSQNMEVLDLNAAAHIPAWFIFYAIGVVFFAFRLMLQIIKPIRVYRKAEVEMEKDCVVVNNTVFDEPFTLFHWIFINTHKYKSTELDVILTHEKVHVHEKHWIDVLIVELLTVLFWFNPFVWMFERAVKKNHEYLADQGVISRGHTLLHYQRILVNQMMGMQVVALSNSLNFALGTNRLNMMKKEKTSRKKLLRIAFLLPIVAAMLYAFAEPNYVNEPTAEKPKDNQMLREKETIPQADTIEYAILNGKIVDDSDGSPLVGATIVEKDIAGRFISATITDKEGNFVLKVQKNEEGIAHMDFGNASYERVEQDIKTDNPDPITIRLKLNTKNEFVVTPNTDQNSIEESIEKEVAASEVFLRSEVMPSYKGGEEVMNQFIDKVIKERKDKWASQDLDLTGKEGFVMFVVNNKGQIENIRGMGENADADKALIEIVQKMPDWTPGTQRGKVVNVQSVLKYTF